MDLNDEAVHIAKLSLWNNQPRPKAEVLESSSVGSLPLRIFLADHAAVRIAAGIP